MALFEQQKKTRCNVNNDTYWPGGQMTRDLKMIKVKLIKHKHDK